MLSVNRRRVKDESNKNKTTDKIMPGRHLVNVNPPQRVSTFMGKVKNSPQYLKKNNTKGLQTVQSTLVGTAVYRSHLTATRFRIDDAIT